MDTRKRDANPELPIRVLFISQSCERHRFTAHIQYAYWYACTFASHAGSRVQVGIAYGASDEAEHGSSSVAGSVSGSDIRYYPLTADLRHGATGPEWEVARCALLDAIGRFEPDIIQCFGSEWPHGAIAEDVDLPVIIHMMGFLNIYYPAIGMAVRGDAEKPSWRIALSKLFFRKKRRDVTHTLLERNTAFERRVMRANRFFLGRTEWDRNIVKYYSPGSQYFEVPEMLRAPFLRAAGSWRNQHNDRLRLLTTASADDRKGLEIVLQAAELLKELVGIDFEWRIAGREEHFDRFERRCGICHDQVNVRLLGMLEAEDLVVELQHADLFIHPSIIDNSPRALCEAQLIGCPTIASNVGGVPQLVEQGVTGFLYPYNEPHTLAFLIANLAEQREVLVSISKAASHTARERHDPKTITDRMIDVYREVIASYEK